MNLGIEYIKYRWKALRRHGVHSPFIYNLTDKCFRTPSSSALKEKLRHLHYQLHANNEKIEITDFGAGSRKLGKNRTIKSIYRTSSSKGKYGKLLYQLVNYFRPENVLEFGTSLGIGTVCMASGNKSSTVISVEGCKKTHNQAKKNIELLGIKNIQLINKQFVNFDPSKYAEQFNLVFIDGHHDGDALLHCMNRLEPFTNNETVFVLDDIRWSDSMFEAWNSIVNNPQYSVTIDLFRVGIAIRRTEQRKEHFVLRN